jgi:hypothetical protein
MENDALLDFASLRSRGVELLQRLAGASWTDHNAHDPGITILEQLCYALTDLGYRAQYDLPDLLARDGEDPYASLYTPAQILPTSPVTLADLRALVIDVPGVKNAWIEVVNEPCAMLDAAQGEVSHPAPHKAADGPVTASPNVSEIRVKGLYQVRIEKSDLAGVVGDQIRRDVAQRLHACRALGTDFQDITVLEQQDVGLAAALEIGAVEDAAELLAAVYRAIAEYMSPPVPFRTLREMMERGRRVDEIFEGPLLEQGFLDPQDLARMERRTTLRISDLIRALMAVPGVAAVKSLHFLTGGEERHWVLEIPASKTPRFNLSASIREIKLHKRDMRVDDDATQDKARDRYTEHAARQSRPAAGSERDLRPRPGRDRKVAAYHSVQEQFPMAYGIGSAGLPRSAPPERKARALQLKAYLMFYDQVLANQFAQLANAGRLLSFHDTGVDSYFSQPVQDDGALGLDALRVSPPRKDLQRITEAARAGIRRRHRFLDHLLARFGEQFREYDLVEPGTGSEDMTPEERLAHHKRAFLRDYPRIGRDRGTGFDYLSPRSESNLSGLEQALRRKLGIVEAEEDFHIVEHVLLRPIAGDRFQSGPLLRLDPKQAESEPDPYSLQLTFVFPSWPKRYRDDPFKRFVEHTVREETPAHLAVRIRWREMGEMQAFKKAHEVWLERLRSHRRAELGLEA